MFFENREVRGCFAFGYIAITMRRPIGAHSGIDFHILQFSDTALLRNTLIVQDFCSRSAFQNSEE